MSSGELRLDAVTVDRLGLGATASGEQGSAGGLGCDHCRAAVLSQGLPMVGLSLVGHVIVLRCPTCSTFWLETERLAYPVRRGDAVREAPDVPLDV